MKTVKRLLIASVLILPFVFPANAGFESLVKTGYRQFGDAVFSFYEGITLSSNRIAFVWTEEGADPKSAHPKTYCLKSYENGEDLSVKKYFDDRVDGYLIDSYQFCTLRAGTLMWALEHLSARSEQEEVDARNIVVEEVKEEDCTAPDEAEQNADEAQDSLIRNAVTSR